MSKAFVKEPEGDDDEDDDAPAPAAQKGGNHITLEGFNALKAELDRLWKVERPRVTEEVSVAAAQGDRSENAEYIYGKKKLREIDKKIRFLTRRLDAVTVVVPSQEQLGKVYFGAWFTIEDEDGNESTYRIVGTDETDLAAKKISIRSPVAQALLGKAEGDSALVQRPKGPAEVTVVKVWYG
ncbi:MAG: transcription elongation factor GreB [Polyangiaceae bacterium]|nr:transcription elongation factor GreB [Polyangiaceae bacterium]MBK8943260.1 transcription elongation factor GreB [Polyangiaceae bacterium]